MSQVLETPDSERARFLWATEETAPFEDRVQASYQGEIERLTTQLPLMESVTRYEFNKYRLCVHCCCLFRVAIGCCFVSEASLTVCRCVCRREFQKQTGDPQRLLGADSASLLRDERARKEVHAIDACK